MESKFSISGFKEAVFVVADLVRSKTFYQDVIGWQLISESQDDNRLNPFWQLEAHVNIKSCLLSESGEPIGAIRLVEIDVDAHSDIEQIHIRANSQIWDTGGIFDVNCRVKDIHHLATKLNTCQWFGNNLPVPMRFGPFKVYEWLVKSHDGIVHALIERIEPPIENDQQTALFSALINASMIVNDHQSERSFFTDVLGFEALIEQEGSFDEACSNVFGMPQELVAQTPHELTLMSPDGSRQGTIELASFSQLTGNDYSDNAQPYNLGITSLRFPVQGIDALKQHLLNKGICFTDGGSLTVAPYGEIAIIAVQTPAGNRLEFFE